MTRRSLGITSSTPQCTRGLPGTRGVCSVNVRGVSELGQCFSPPLRAHAPSPGLVLECGFRVSPPGPRMVRPLLRVRQRTRGWRCSSGSALSPAGPLATRVSSPDDNDRARSARSLRPLDSRRFIAGIAQGFRLPASLRSPPSPFGPQSPAVFGSPRPFLPPPAPLFLAAHSFFSLSFCFHIPVRSLLGEACPPPSL